MADQDSTPPQPGKRRGRPRASEIAAQLSESGGVTPFPDGPADADGLTLRQRRILEVVKDTVERRGYPPSIREMGDAVGLASSSSVAHQLRVLEGKGHLRHEADQLRYVYLPAASPQRIRRSAVKHLLDTFFDGSPEKVVEALVGRDGPGISDDALDRIAELVERARREGKRK